MWNSALLFLCIYFVVIDDCVLWKYILNIANIKFAFLNIRGLKSFLAFYGVNFI